MAANTKTTQTYDNRTSRDNALKKAQVQRSKDYQRINKLVGPQQLGLQQTIDPLKYAAIVHGLQRFWDNRVLWDTEKDATLLRQHLAFTLSVPGGRADRAREAVDMLTAEGYLGDIKARGWDDAAVAILKPRVRFYNQKARRIEDCLMKFEGMRRQLPQITDNMEKRKWLEWYMPGFGPKAATHFMRNSGLMSYMDGLPIIDVHIHKVLEHFGFKHSEYEESCHAFKSLSDLVEIPVLILDAVLWCAYANNWEVDEADFDNFGVTEPLKTGTVNNGTGKDINRKSANRRTANRSAA